MPNETHEKFQATLLAVAQEMTTQYQEALPDVSECRRFFCQALHAHLKDYTPEEQTECLVEIATASLMAWLAETAVVEIIRRSA